MKTAMINMVKRIPAKKKILSLVLALSLLISLFPITYVTAWSPPANVTINKSANASYFTNQWGTPMTTGFYYVAGSGELAYCADQDATGPGGTGYSLNDSGLGNTAYLSGIQAILQNGYPFTTCGLSAEDARYGTQVAIHWIENYYLGAGQGYDASIRGATNANGHDGALAFSLALYDIGVSVAPINPVMYLGAPSAWADAGGGVIQCTMYVDESYTDYWQILSLPAGVTSVGGTTFTGDVTLTLQLTDAATYAASPHAISIEGYTNRDTSNIHVFTTSGGYQSMVGVSTQSNGLDPESLELTDANGTLSLYKRTMWSTGVYSSEAGARFQIIDSASAVASTITTNASGNASVSLPYGTYTIHQISGPAYTNYAPDQSYTVDANSTTATITNAVFTGRLEVNKTYAAATGSVPEAGAVFQVYPVGATYAGSAAYQRDQITTNAAGYAITKALPYDRYQLVQISAPTGSQINPNVRNFDLGLDGVTYIDADVDTVSVNNAPTTGKLELSKTTNRGYSIAETGAVFEVCSTSFASYAAAPAARKDTITTSAFGTAITKDLPFGVYRIHQTVVPAGTIAAADSTVTIGATHNAAIHRDLVNQVYWGQAEIIKTTEYAGNVTLEAGAMFQIYNTAYASFAAAPAEEKDTITTDGNGHAVSKRLPYGTYIMTQTGSPAGTVLNTGTWTFVLGMDETTYVNNDIDKENIVNAPTFGQLELSKTTDRGYSVEEAGATFEIYSSEYSSFAAAPAEYKDTITTDSNGDAITKLLPYGDYIVRQSVAPAGTRAVADYTVSLKVANGTVVHQDLVNETYWGDIQVLKYKISPSDATGTPIPESGATFRIYPSAYSTWDAALSSLNPSQEAVLLDEITSDMAGIASSSHRLPYGEYTVEQIDTVANLYTFKVDAWQVFIGAVDDQTYTYVRNNEIYEQYLSIIKTDAETGQVIKLAGATFQILSEDGMTVLSDKNGRNSFTTDRNGRIDISNLPLQVGRYFVREIQAPIGYTLNSDLKPFAVSIADHGSSLVTINYGKDVRPELFSDTAQTCCLIVEKLGDVLTAATQIEAINPNTGIPFSDEEGNSIFISKFGYSLTGKAGAVFEVFVGDKDIGDNEAFLKMLDTDGDGTQDTSLSAGASLGLITTSPVTQKDGTVRYIASLAGLPLDALTGTAQYVVREVKAPVGDLINPEELTFDFTFADQTVSEIQQEQSLTDARQIVSIIVEKQKEAAVWNPETSDFDWPLTAAPEILFGLYTRTDILSPDGAVLVPADTLADVLYTDDNGTGHTSQDLPFGDYYAKELTVTSDVIRDTDTEYPVTASPLVSQTIRTAVFELNGGEPVVNREISGSVSIYKKAADTNLPMSGVTFEVYDIFGNLVQTITTQGDGTAKTRILPFGQYTMLETRTTTGYAFSERQTFSIEMAQEAGEAYENEIITVINQKMAQIKIYKVTADKTQTPMDGVVFGIFNDSGTKVASITTDKTGYGSAYLPRGDFYLKELVTWEGYILSEDIISVTTEWAQVYTYKVTNDLTQMKVTKMSTGGTMLEGMGFTVTDESTGDLVSLIWSDVLKAYIPDQTQKSGTVAVTGSDGTAIIVGLAEGSYLVTETKAPVGYRMDAEPVLVYVTASMSGSDPASVTIKDSPVVPRTGETQDMKKVAAGIGLLVGFALVQIIRKNNRAAKRRKVHFKGGK